MLNDQYLPGALLLANQLRAQWTQADLVCLVSEGVGSDSRDSLAVLFDRVVEVPPLFVPHARRQARQDRPWLLTRLQALRLGPDGDLGCSYEKIVLLDADILPIKRFDHLFLLNTPAGVLNERKSHFVSLAADRTYRLPADVELTGRWIWHEIYGAMGHGERIPAEITLRVRDDPTNLGVNAALLVLRPCMRELASIRKDIERPSVRRLLEEVFDWPDMQYLTLRWSGRWTNADACFCGLCGYPSLPALCGTHFAGPKPWDLEHDPAVRAYARYPDFRYWYRCFEIMMSLEPVLRANPRLSRLAHAVQTCRVHYFTAARKASTSAVVMNPSETATSPK